MKRHQMSTVSGFLSLPVLVQFEHVEEDLAGQAALAAATVGREKRRRGLQRGQTPAGGPHRVQRRPCVPTTPRLTAALHRQMTAAEEKTHTDVASVCSQPQWDKTAEILGQTGDHLSFLRSR